MAVVLALSALTIACRGTEPVRPAIVPGVEIKMPTPQKPVVKAKEVKKYNLGLIGGVEPVYFMPMKSPFLSRIDTGAETSSIDAADIAEFERDGEKWVAFDLINRQSGEKHHFEKKIVRQVNIKRIEDTEKRITVLMNVKIGGQIIKAQFSLAERGRFVYQGLIGRNIISGRAIVDPSLTNTLK